MALLKVLAIMTALAATEALSGGSMCNPNNSVRDVMMRCFQMAGISAEEVMKFKPNKEGMSTVTKEDLEQMCAKKDQYIQAHECVKDHAMRCPKTFPMDLARHMDDASRMLNMTCSDPQISLECISALLRNAAELRVCMEEVKESYGEAMSPEVEKCYMGMAYKSCSIRLLRACDAYTANQYDNMLSMIMPNRCSME